MKKTIENFFQYLKKIENKKILFFLCFLIFVILFIMCYYTFPTPDDFNYAHIPWTTTPLRSLGDVFRSQMNIYKLWSGRVLIFTIEQLFAMTHPIIFPIVNAVMFVALIYCMVHFTKSKNVVKKVLFIFLCIWFFVPSFAENFVWLCGSFNYLWPCFFVMMAILLFYRRYILKKKDKGSYFVPFFILLGAASHENASFLLGSFLGCYVIFHFKEFFEMLKRKDILMIVNVICFFGGFAFLLLAPGNFDRASGSDFKPSFHIILENLKIIRSLLAFVSVSLLLLLLHKEKKKVGHIFMYFVIPSFLSLVPMFFINEFPLRCLLAFCLMMIVVLLLCFGYFIKRYEKTTTVLLCLGFILLLPSVLTTTNYYLTEARTYKENVDFTVKYSENAGYKEWVIDEIGIDTSVASKYIMAPEFRPNEFSNSIANKYFCMNYGCNRVLSKNKMNVLVEMKLSKDTDFSYDYFIMVNGNRINPIRPYYLNPGTEKENENILTFQIPKTEMSHIDFIVLENHVLSLESIKIYGIGDVIEVKEDSLKDLCLKEEKVEKIDIEGLLAFKASEENGTVSFTFDSVIK